jgi:hypothetical protein
VIAVGDFAEIRVEQSRIGFDVGVWRTR